MWALSRNEGTQIWWDNCDLSNATMVDHKCNVMEDLEILNCKLYPREPDAEGKTGVGSKDRCVAFDNVIISCMSGECKNVSSVYSCT